MTTAANDNRPPEFDALVMRLLPFLHKIAFKLERNEQDREDLINETIAVALHRWQGYRKEGNFAGWLAFQMRERAKWMRKQRSVKAVSYDAPREHRNRDGDSFSDTILDQYAEPARQIDAVELSQVVDAMRPGRPRDVLLRIACGEELGEVAPDYGISRERVRQIADDERARLRKALNTVKVAA